MKILLATDGSDAARAAVDFLLRFPLPGGSEVTVATVIKEVLPLDQIKKLSGERRKALDAARRSATDEARALADSEAKRIRDAGPSATSRVLFGPPAEEIVRLATEMQSDIITLGSHGLSGPKRFLLGSVSDRVFEYARCSVLIVKSAAPSDSGQAAVFPARGDPWRMLLAFDNSPPARKAVELCASLPLKSGSAIRAVTVMPMIHMYRQDIRQQLSWVWQEKKRAAEMGLEWLAAEMDRKDVAVETELLENSDVAQAILDVAADFGSDLIVVGNKSRTAFERFLLGSVTVRVAHHAYCSVLSVRNG
jgi:nucleotide-binding universal stress UspA family protein